MRFDRLGIFTYSHEENTASYALPDDVPAGLKKRRADEVMALQQAISLDLNRRRIGTTLNVLIDRKEGGTFIGRTEFDSPEVDNEVLLDASSGYLRIGDFARVRITGATEFDLTAVPA
jgi:ribosomal protein S12 methylthiotransferase